MWIFYFLFPSPNYYDCFSFSLIFRCRDASTLYVYTQLSLTRWRARIPHIMLFNNTFVSLFYWHWFVYYTAYHSQNASLYSGYPLHYSLKAECTESISLACKIKKKKKETEGHWFNMKFNMKLIFKIRDELKNLFEFSLSLFSFTFVFSLFSVSISVLIIN